MTQSFPDAARYRRAMRFSNAVQSILQDFLPPGREARQLITEHLLNLGINQNFAIIEVPPEYDALNEAQIQTKLVETHPLYVAGTLDILKP